MFRLLRKVWIARAILLPQTLSLWHGLLVHHYVVQVTVNSRYFWGILSRNLHHTVNERFNELACQCPFQQSRVSVLTQFGKVEH